ncbi:MAG: MerR family DNA-binding protein [Robiginitomaculum sp.]|jgi:MerR family mercuric resistance operon transcriptional regulator|nr:MerR family DNA-binding protein [Robiginitomaculum sp.]
MNISTNLQFGIGELSRRASVNIETIRYYEKIDLLPTAKRSFNGHRIYNISTQRKLQFIRRARELGFSIDDIRSLIGIDERPVTCGEVNKITAKHLINVQLKIDRLQSLQQTLLQAAESCEQLDKKDCPIIDALSE